MSYQIKKIPKVKYRVMKGPKLITRREQINKVSKEIRRTLKLHRNIRKTVKTYRATKDSIYRIKNKIHPKVKKEGFISSANNAVFNKIKESDNLALSSISETREKYIQGRRTVKTGVRTVRKTYKLLKHGAGTTKKVYRLANNFYYKAHGLDPIPVVNKKAKENKKKPDKVKTDGILSNAKNNLIEATRVEENSISDGFINAIHTMRDTKGKIEPASKLAGAGYKYIFKPASKYAFNKTKELAINAARGHQLDKLTNLRTQKQSLTKNATFKFRNSNTGYSLRSTHKYSVKQGIKTAKNTRSIKSVKASANLLLKSKMQVTKVVRMMTNPLFLKGAAAALAFFLFIVIIENSMSAVTAPLSVFVIDKDVANNYKSHMNRLDDEFNRRIDSLKNKPGYDDHVLIHMNEDGASKTNWKDLLSIIAVKYEQDLKCNNDEIRTLTNLFNASNKITEREETYEVPVQHTIVKKDKDGKTYTETVTEMEQRKRLIIQVYSYGFEDIIDGVGFSEEQKEWARRLSTSDLSEVFPDIPGLDNELLSSDQIKELIKNAPSINVKRESIVETALSLVGKVGYFWGGKSPAGWNEQWGKPTLVTSPGSQTTNTYQPYGLDCSGFVDWVYKTAGVGNVLSGGGTTYQWMASYPITEEELKAGDLVFKSSPNSGGTGHVGIFLGYDNNGNKLYVHCASGTGVTVNSYSGFRYWRRAYVKLDM